MWIYLAYLLILKKNIIYVPYINIIDANVLSKQKQSY